MTMIAELTRVATHPPQALARRRDVRAARHCGFSILLALAGTAAAMTGGSVEARFRGVWTPAKGNCATSPRVVIEANRVTFVNGAQRAGFSKLEQCFTCAAGGMTTAAQPVWLTTDAMGDSPFTITLDGTRRTAVVSVDFSNDKRLAARFPLGTAPLKKCP